MDCVYLQLTVAYFFLGKKNVTVQRRRIWDYSRKEVDRRMMFLNSWIGWRCGSVCSDEVVSGTLVEPLRGS